MFCASESCDGLVIHRASIRKVKKRYFDHNSVRQDAVSPDKHVSEIID